MPFARNKIRRAGPVAWALDPHGEAFLPGNQMFVSNLKARVIDSSGSQVEEHDLGSGLVTTAGVGLLAGDYAQASGQQTLKIANYHHSGTGAVGATISNTALGTPTADARVAGTQSNPTAGQYRTVATCTYAGTQTITEWGLFCSSASGVLWDRRTFSGIATDTSTSIEFTYTLTVTPGG